MAGKTVKRGKVPQRYLNFQKQYPAVFKAYKDLGHAVTEAGPLDLKTRELVRLAIVIGARHEGAVHSHTRRALEAGCTPAEIRHAALLSVTSIGFPNMMAAMSWVDDVLDQ
jgi:alkylhydroperoxidase/carboxymuconolactone decarboxylase family protein YurZ